MGISPPKAPIATSQIAQDVLDQEQTQIIYQDFRRNTLQAYIKYKAYYDRKANASKLKEANYVIVLHAEADYQGSKIPLTEFRWIDPYNIEKVLPNNHYLVHKNATNKTQVLQRMRMRHCTPHQTIPDIRITPQE